MVHVPYKGGPEALQAVVTGEVCCIMNQVQTVLGQWRAGKVRLLGVTTKQRVGAVQDVPTIDEAGVPGYESYIWFGLFGPKGLDPRHRRADQPRGEEGARSARRAREDGEPRQCAALRDASSSSAPP